MKNLILKGELNVLRIAVGRLLTYSYQTISLGAHSNVKSLSLLVFLFLIASGTVELNVGFPL
jgi:hypothetical protein